MVTPRSIPAWGRQWVTGRCFDFAIALAERIPDAEFVRIGSESYPDHVGVRFQGAILDIRGVLDEAAFRSSHATLPFGEIPRATVELHAGLSGVRPPYRGIPEMKEARLAVARRFPDLDTIIAELTPRTIGAP